MPDWVKLRSGVFHANEISMEMNKSLKILGPLHWLEISWWWRRGRRQRLRRDSHKILYDIYTIRFGFLMASCDIFFVVKITNGRILIPCNLLVPLCFLLYAWKHASSIYSQNVDNDMKIFLIFFFFFDWKLWHWLLSTF